MKRRCLLVLSVIVLASASALSATEVSREVGGRSYVESPTGWLQVEPDGSRFEVDPRVITVRFRASVPEAAQDSLFAELGGVELRRAITGFVDVQIAKGRDPIEAAATFGARPEIEIAEANTIGRYLFVPNDALYGNQWHLPQVLAEDAWDFETGEAVAVIAVLDSGTEFTHEDLGTGPDAYQNIWLNAGEDAWSDPTDPSTGNGIDDDGNGFIDDWKGWDFGNGNNNPAGPFFHGTAVAGVASAKMNNAIGVAGVAGGNNGPGARVMIGGVGDTAPNGAVLDDAILYAADEGAHIIQLSLTVGQSAAIDAALQMAWDNFNMISICSSGNGGGNSVGYPSSNPDVISVGSTNMADLKSGFSQFGPNLELAAPGEGIWTTDLGSGYGPSTGTSFSSPLASGIVALMISANPSLTNAQIRQILHDTADKVGPYDYNWNPAMPGHSQELGYGRVDADEAVRAAGIEIFADGFESGDTSAWSSSSP